MLNTTINDICIKAKKTLTILSKLIHQRDTQLLQVSNKITHNNDNSNKHMSATFVVKHSIMTCVVNIVEFAETVTSERFTFV